MRTLRVHRQMNPLPLQKPMVTRIGTVQERRCQMERKVGPWGLRTGQSVSLDQGREGNSSWL